MKTTFSRIATILVMFVTISSMCFAQHITKEQFKDLMAMNVIETEYNNGTADIDKMLKSMNVDTTNIDKNAIMDDIVDCLSQYYIHNITKADYNSIKDNYNAEKQNGLRAKHEQCMQKIFSEMNSTIGEYEKKVVGMLNGEQVEPLKSECPESFKNKCLEMYIKAGTKDYIETVFGKISELLVNGNANRQQMASMRLVMQSFINDFSTIYSNVAYGIYSEDEIDYIISNFNTKAYQHVVKSNIEMLNDIDNLNANIRTKVSECAAM